MKNKMKKLFELIKQLYNKYKELIMYGIMGVLSTVINIVTFAICEKIFGINALVSNVIAWVVAVIFAYITNKLFVFESKSFKKDVLIKEIISFTSARLFSLLLEEVIIYVMIDLMNINSLIVKVFSNIVVIIVNYIFSKLVIFKKKEN
jgi:putative flippase GtrA